MCEPMLIIRRYKKEASQSWTPKGKEGLASWSQTDGTLCPENTQDIHDKTSV